MRRMENLVFSLNATVPIFLMMVLGMLFRKLGWMDEEFAAKMNKFVFLIPLPVLLFGDLAKVDFKEVWNIRYCSRNSYLSSGKMGFICDVCPLCIFCNLSP